MPVERGNDGKPFYRWGKQGKRYHYISGNVRSRQQAHAKAARQGRAIKTRQSRPGYGRKDASQRGWKRGGRGRNRTTNCRHPSKRKKR